MTWKVGDSVTIPIKLASVYGQSSPQYSSYAAFQAAGWSLSWLQAGVAISSQPTVSAFAPDPGAPFDGTHYVTFALPYGVTTMKVRAPASGQYFSVYDVLEVVPVADTDTLQATLSSSVGTPVSGSSLISATDITVVEGDSLQAQFTLLASQLKILDATNKIIFAYGNLADIGGQTWTIACQARYVTENGQLPSAAVAFTLQAAILDKTNLFVGIGWQSAPAGAIVDDLLPSAPTVTVSGGAITGTSGGTGGHFYGSNVPTVSLSGGGGTGGVLTPIISNGAVTGYTVTNAGSGYATPPTAMLAVASDGSVLTRRFSYDIQLQPPSGSTYAGAKLTVVSGNLYIARQQTTTP